VVEGLGDSVWLVPLMESAGEAEDAADGLHNNAEFGMCHAMRQAIIRIGNPHDITLYATKYLSTLSFWYRITCNSVCAIHAVHRKEHRKSKCRKESGKLHTYLLRHAGVR